MRTLVCPRCRGKWQVEAVQAGMKAVCPHCQASMTIASAPPGKSGVHGVAKATPPQISAAPGLPSSLSTAPSSPPAKAKESTEKTEPVPAPAVQHAPPAERKPVVLPEDTTLPPHSLAESTTAQKPVGAKSSAAVRSDAALPIGISESRSAVLIPNADAAVEPTRRAKAPLVLVLITLAGLAAASAYWQPWKLLLSDADTAHRGDETAGPSVDRVPTPPPKTLIPPTAVVPRNNDVATATNTAATPLSVARPSVSDVSAPPIPAAAELPPPKVSVSATPVLIAASSPPAPAATKPSPSGAGPVAVKSIVAPTASAKSIATPNAKAGAAISTSPTSASVTTPKAGVYDRAPLPPGTEGTQPVGPTARLKAGDRLHAQYDGKWYAVTVVGTLDDGKVRVRWETWGADYVGNIGRDKLRVAY